MFSEIVQIQNWFKKHVGIPAPDGDYIVPINGEKWNVTITNDRIWIKGKVKRVEPNGIPVIWYLFPFLWLVVVHLLVRWLR